MSIFTIALVVIGSFVIWTIWLWFSTPITKRKTEELFPVPKKKKRESVEKEPPPEIYPNREKDPWYPNSTRWMPDSTNWVGYVSELNALEDGSDEIPEKSLTTAELIEILPDVYKSIKGIE